MRKTFLLMALMLVSTSAYFAASAQTISNFYLEKEFGTSFHNKITVTSPTDSFEVYDHFDTDTLFPNAFPNMSSTLYPPGTHTIDLWVDSLTAGTYYFNRVTVNVYGGATLTRILGVQTTREAEIGQDLTSNLTSQTTGIFHVTYICHGSMALIGYHNLTDDTVLYQTNLSDTGFASAYFPFTQAGNTTKDWQAFIVNASNPMDTSFSNIWTVITPPSWANPPLAIDITVGSISPTTLNDVHFTGTTDSLQAIVYIEESCDSTFASPILVSVFATQPGAIDTTFDIPNSCNGGPKVWVRMTVENAFNGLTRSMVTRSFMLPVAPIVQDLRPVVESIDYGTYSAVVALHFRVATNGSSVGIYSIEKADSMGAPYSSFWTVGVNDSVVRNTFYMAFNTCYYLKGFKADTAYVESWFIESEVCSFITGIGEVPIPSGYAPVSGFAGSRQDFDLEKDFATGYAWPIQVYDLRGNLILDDNFSSFSDSGSGLRDQLRLRGVAPNTTLILRTYDKRTQITKTTSFGS